MHSRIFNLSDKQTDLLSSSEMENEFIDNGFIGTYADYVSAIEGEEQKKEEIEWFVESLEKYVEYDPEAKTITFKESVVEILKASFASFKEQVAQLTEEQFISGLGQELYLTEEQFISGLGQELYRIQQTIQETFGFWIYYQDCYYDLNEFIRIVIRYENKTFYVGGILDYHN